MATPSTDTLRRLIATFNNTPAEALEILRIARRLGLKVEAGAGGSNAAGTPVWQAFTAQDSASMIDHKVADVRERTANPRLVVSIMKRVQFGRSKRWTVDRKVVAAL